MSVLSGWEIQHYTASQKNSSWQNCVSSACILHFYKIIMNFFSKIQIIYNFIEFIHHCHQCHLVLLWWWCFAFHREFTFQCLIVSMLKYIIVSCGCDPLTREHKRWFEICIHINQSKRRSRLLWILPTLYNRSENPIRKRQIKFYCKNSIFAQMMNPCYHNIPLPIKQVSAVMGGSTSPPAPQICAISGTITNENRLFVDIGLYSV